MKAVAVIPARYESSRFPGKVLAKQTGKYLIQHVYERVRDVSGLDEVIIATDSDRVAQACAEFGADCRMTGVEHQSGTDRIAEVATNLTADVVVNVQGDEPEIDPGHVEQLLQLMARPDEPEMATLCSPLHDDDEINNPNVVKVVTDRTGRALYFSRWPIPYRRDADTSAAGLYRKHLGIYAYRRDVLLRLSGLAPTPLEQAERLEQLRALENGISIVLGVVEHTAVGVDTPEQYDQFVQRYRQTAQC